MGNRENGRSAIKLIFTVTILVAIITGMSFTVKRLWQDTSVKDIGTDLLYIKTRCKIIHDKNIIDANEQLLGENITEYTENEVVNEIVSQSNKWYKLSQEDLEKIGLEELKAEDGYLVNYEEQDIIYVKGIERDKEIYYKLSDLEKIEEEEEKKKEQEKEEKTNTEVEPQINEEPPVNAELPVTEPVV